MIPGTITIVGFKFQEKTGGVPERFTLWALQMIAGTHAYLNRIPKRRILTQYNEIVAGRLFVALLVDVVAPLNAMRPFRTS